MMEHGKAIWKVYTKRADFYRLGEQLGIDPVIARVMVNRGIPEDKMAHYLRPDKSAFHDPHLMKGVDEAVCLLQQAIACGKHIRVIGDYDVDGIFATYILVKGLSRCGAKISYDIPHRIHDGYGINKRMVERARAEGANLILTCDNGIKAPDEVKLAKELGMSVIVTDHHELGFDLDEKGERIYQLPEADCIVNPHQPGCEYPFKNICGAVVAWKLIEALYEKEGFAKESEEFLPFAAFATLGDVMPLFDENRSMVYFGLKMLPRVKNPGMRSLIERTGLSGRISSFDVGFVLGPCFNAAGRLDTAQRGEELLLEQDVLKASAMAEALRNLNEQRKAMTEDGLKAALDTIKAGGLEQDTVLVVHVPGLHESLAGIVAGRIKERFFRPTYVLTDGENCIKGSGRSIPGYSMAAKLHDVEDLLIRYGGHPMAAGLSMPSGNVEEFRKRLNENSGLSEEQLVPTVWIDVPMPLSYITSELIRQLDLLEPFGEGNEKPLFAVRNVEPLSAGYFGKEQRFVKFFVRGKGGVPMEALYFRDGPQMIRVLEDRYGAEEVDKLFHRKRSAVRLTFSYYPTISRYMGQETLQVIIDDYR